MFKFIAITTLFFSLQVNAADNECQKAYGESISQCAHDLDLLAPKLRAGAQKACVAEAKVAKDACLVGPNSCLTACQATYQAAENVCTQAFDPIVCAGNLACIDFYNGMKAICIGHEVDALNLCTQSCL